MSFINLGVFSGQVGISASFAKAQGAAFSVTIPANSVITGIDIINTTANAITGGIKVGSTSGAVDIVVAQAVAGNQLVSVLDASILKRVFSTTASQTIFFDAVTAWNSATVNAYVRYVQLP